MADRTPEDCGRVPTGVEVSRTVSVKNTRPEPVSIRLLSKTCGCVAARIEPAEIPPGESAEITLSTRSAPLGGDQAHSAWFGVGREIKPGEWAQLCTLTVSFRYTPDVEFMVFPPNRVLAHAVVAQAKDIVVYVNADRIQARPPHGLLSSTPEIEPVGVVNVPENKNVVKLLFRARPTSVGVLQGTISFETGSERFPKVALPITVVVRPALLVDPPGLILDGDKVAAGARFECTVRAREGLAGSVLSSVQAVAESGRVDARIERSTDGGTVHLVVGVEPAAIRESGSERVWLQDDKGNKLAEVPIAWTGRR